MTITRVERLRSRQARYRVSLDDAEPIVLSEDLLVRLGLAPGDTLTPARAEEIREASEQESAKQAAYRFISYRPRSEQEVRNYLRRKGFRKDRARSVTEEFVRLRLVDDEEFAAMLVRDVVTRGRSGPAAIRRKLAEKGISRDVIDRLIAAYVPDDLQIRQAVDLLRKRIDRGAGGLRRLDPVKRRARLYQYLCQRGFSSRTAMQALSSVEV